MTFERRVREYEWVFGLALVVATLVFAVYWLGIWPSTAFDRTDQVTVEPEDGTAQTTALLKEIAAQRVVIWDLRRQIAHKPTEIKDVRAAEPVPGSVPEAVDLVPELYHELLQLTHSQQAQVSQLIKKQRVDVTETNMFDEGLAHRRRDVLRDFLDGLVGEDRRRVMEDQLWVEADKHRFDHLAFMKADKIAQSIFGVLCYPCDPKERVR